MANDPKFRRRIIDRRQLRDELSGQTLPLHRVSSGGAEGSDRSDEYTPPNRDDTEVNDVIDLNSLRIEGRAFSLELEGDAEFINSAYDSVRASIIARLRTTVTGEFALPSSKGSSAPAAPDRGAPEGTTGGYVWVYVCHELYRKIHVVSRAGIEATPLAKILDPYKVGRVYVDRRDLKDVADLVGSGKTLWSELTAEGRRRLARGQR